MVEGANEDTGHLLASDYHRSWIPGLVDSWATKANSWSFLSSSELNKEKI